MALKGLNFCVFKTIIDITKLNLFCPSILSQQVFQTAKYTILIPLILLFSYSLFFYFGDKFLLFREESSNFKIFQQEYGVLVKKEETVMKPDCLNVVILILYINLNLGDVLRGYEKMLLNILEAEIFAE
jgi:hypothetical protein